MAATGKKREERAARERARTYAARQDLHERAVRRRWRDNLVVGIAGGALVVVISLLQFAYYSQPAPSSTETPAATDVPTATDTATPEATTTP
ncbi:MAG: dioxygenase [Microbacterium sp.]|uniref:dioxygenase n=1 Tax=Microbacterium sp. TaxID=51671 RepID=UPI0039E55B12